MKKQNQIMRDIDHLVAFNKNGLWIKETLNNNERIITASNPEGFEIFEVNIYELNKDFNLKKIIADKANIKSTEWILSNVTIFTFDKGVVNKETIKNYRVNSIYNHDKIINLFNNTDTFSFLEVSIILAIC